MRGSVCDHFEPDAVDLSGHAMQANPMQESVSIRTVLHVKGTTTYMVSFFIFFFKYEQCDATRSNRFGEAVFGHTIAGQRDAHECLFALLLRSTCHHDDVVHAALPMRRPNSSPPSSSGRGSDRGILGLIQHIKYSSFIVNQ